MTNAATGPVATQIAVRLARALEPSLLEIINDSASHAGHMGDDGSGESHFTVVIESAAFVGQSRVARQRLVNQALGDLMDGTVHALVIKAKAPEEA
ncbi:MAG: BolA family transcriptional regulator [Sphingomonas sp. 28-62-20]|uniref:BolA family protein n=1 Tax=Sphingomonas sp. 28-62-20 TaxID=1970433 RepID=UPI000A642C01|nr:MAG: BolA family transcriptional regulator [Sphingomonas sp. 28-62-20]